MMKTVSMRMLIIVIVILGISSIVHSLEMLETVIQINNDFEMVFATDPKESESIFDKYRDEKYHPIFTQIFSAGKYDDKLLYDVIYISAVLKDGRYLEYVRSGPFSNSLSLEDVIKFYYYRIGYEKVVSIKFLRKKLDNVVKNPTDNYLITFLAFFDDIDFSLLYMDKLAHVTDGAASELLSWTVNYLFYKNMQNKDALGKIKRSYCYKLYIKKRANGKDTEGSP